MANTSKLRLRLNFNFRTGSAKKEKIRTFATAIAQEVMIDASEKVWSQIEGRLQRRIYNDVLAEISNMARLYRQYIIGISGTRVGAYGKLQPVSIFARGAVASDLTYALQSGAAGRWAARGGKHYYLAWKQRHVHHQRWFEHTGLLQKSMSSGRAWLGYFGPIVVTVTRSSLTMTDAKRLADSQSTTSARAEALKRFDAAAPTRTGSELRTHVATIRVEAMRNITPEMLPALLNEDINDMPADGRSTGLTRLLPKDVAEHLAGSSQEKNFVPYRHTIEPFLGFVLTRAIPNAVTRRIQDGIRSDIRHE